MDFFFGVHQPPPPPPVDPVLSERTARTAELLVWWSEEVAEKADELIELVGSVQGDK